MKLRLVKMTIPRQMAADGQPVNIKILADECEKPVHKVLVAMLGRLYHKERTVSTAK